MTLSKLLILSASYGQGHQQAALAVRDAVHSISPATSVRIVDYIHTVHPAVNSIVRYCYLQSVRYAPALYGLFYKGTSQIAPDSLIQRQLNSLGIYGLELLLEDYRPDVVFSTFPTPAGVMSALTQQGRTQVPTATVITDHAIHSQWIHQNTSLYFVGSEYVRNGLVARGIELDSIHITGIPIRAAFQQPVNRAALVTKYGLRSNVPTVLILAGAYGVLPDVVQICENLLTYPETVQIIVVAGHHDRLQAQLTELMQTSSQPMRVFGYISEIHELMAISDVVLTKPGGLTVTEAIARHLPMLLYRPIPGQETQNAAYLVNSGVALLARDKAEVCEQLRQLLVVNRQQLVAMRQCAAQIRQFGAAEKIAERLIELAPQSESEDIAGKQQANYV